MQEPNEEHMEAKACAPLLVL